MIIEINYTLLAIADEAGQEKSDLRNFAVNEISCRAD